MDDGTRSLREKRKQQTREEIVRVAFDLFGKHGFDKVPVEMICEAAGISRASFFNYFPQKELILRELAHARVEKLKAILADFTAAKHTPAIEDIMKPFLALSKENAALSRNSRQLVLETIIRQGLQGALLPAKKEGTRAIAQMLDRIPRRSKRSSQLVADTLFAIYIATTLEWLFTDNASASWLQKNMRERMELVLEGAA